MKIVHKKYMVLVAVGLSLLGCDNYLEENPDNRVELNNTEKAAQLLTNAYSNAAYTFTEWMSDNVAFTTGTTRLPEHNQAYKWEDIIGVNQDTPTNFWTSTYDAIAHANEVLAVINNLPGDQAHKDAVKGEALLTRAYGHFMLVNLFAKHYEANTASKDPGVPYVEEPEKVFIKQYSRNTVKEVYDKIQRDLLEGLEHIDDRFYANSGKYHFTKNAALAFASRFFLFKKDYENCIKYSSQLLGADPGIYIKDISALLLQTTNSEDFIRAYTSPTDQSNLLMIRHITNFPVNVGYWPNQDLLDAIYDSNPWGADDVRTSAEYPIFIRGTHGRALAKFEFLFERSSLTSNVGLYYTIMPVFRGEEVLLNRAESYTYVNDTTRAIADLKVLATKRYGNVSLTVNRLRTYYGIANPGGALIYFLLDERQKEFMHEGLRWFDLKRYQGTVVHFLENGSKITLSGNDRRKVLQIPQVAIDVGGLEPNLR
jgi:starch-binding outer membrane protein, SusD/RagB family